jgi:hypothetical protein
MIIYLCNIPIAKKEKKIYKITLVLNVETDIITRDIVIQDLEN